MKIVMVCGRSPLDYFGGIEQHVMQICEVLAKRGHQVEIFCPLLNSSSLNTHYINGTTVKTFPGYGLGETYYFSWALFTALKKVDCDILHGHGFQDLPLLSSLLAKKPRQKLVITLHSAGASSLFARLLHVPYIFMVHLVIKKADKIICVSNAEYERFRKYIGLPSEYFSVIPNGVDLDAIRGVCHKNYLLVDRPFILSVTRLEKYKGCDLLLRSFAKLDSFPNLKLVIVGSGPFKNELVKLARKLRVEPRVLFLQRISRQQLITLYKNCEFFAHLSEYESGGISVMEALAAGKPVLVTETSALSEYVEKGLAVGVPYPSHPEIVSLKMKKILDNPSKFFPKNVKINTWEEVAIALEKTYNSLL